MNRVAARSLLTSAMGILLTACGEAADEGEALAQTAVCRVAQRPVQLPADLPESSGVAISPSRPGIVWSHNDSGDPEIFAVSLDGRLQARVDINRANVEDWEDMAAGACPGGPCLYLADIGDNAAQRSEIVVYRVPEPSPGDSVVSTVERFAFRYPEGPRDAEGLFVLGQDQLFIVTKGENSPVEIFRAPSPLNPGSTVDLQLVRRLSPGVVQQPDRVT